MDTLVALDPKVVSDNAPALPIFALACLPTEWATWVDASAGLAGAPVDYAALGLLAAVAGATGAGVVVQPVPGWREPLVLWQCAVGSSGSGKSAALAAGRRLIDAIDDEDDETAPQRVASESTLRALAGVVSRNPNGVVVWRDELLPGCPAADDRAPAGRRRGPPSPSSSSVAPGRPG